MIKETMGDASIHMIETPFRLHEFEFNIDRKRSAIVEIFVADNFLKYLDGTSRFIQIDKFVKNAAPWLFSYSTRIHKEL